MGILLSNPREEVERIIQQYSLSLRQKLFQYNFSGDLDF